MYVLHSETGTKKVASVAATFCLSLATQQQKRKNRESVQLLCTFGTLSMAPSLLVRSRIGLPPPALAKVFASVCLFIETK